MARDERGIVAIFRIHTVKNNQKSIDQGRPIYDDVEVCELRFAGSKTVSVFEAAAFSHWDVDDETGEQRKYTYAERFPRQFQQFRAREQQTKAGTPLDYLPFLTEARRAELRALNVYTVEALASVDGQELKNLGPGAREFKNKAIECLDNSVGNARILKLEAEIDALKAKNMTMEEDLKSKANGHSTTEYDNMTDDQLRDHVKALTGVEPKGNLPRRTLIRMAQENKVAA